MSTLFENIIFILNFTGIQPVVRRLHSIKKIFEVSVYDYLLHVSLFYFHETKYF